MIGVSLVQTADFHAVAVRIGLYQTRFNINFRIFKLLAQFNRCFGLYMLEVVPFVRLADIVMRLVKADLRLINAQARIQCQTFVQSKAVTGF